MNPFPPPPTRLQKVLPGPLAIGWGGCPVVAAYCLNDWSDSEDADSETELWAFARRHLSAYLSHVSRYPDEALAIRCAADDGAVRVVVIDLLPPNVQGWLL